MTRSEEFHIIGLKKHIKMLKNSYGGVKCLSLLSNKIGENELAFLYMVF